MIRHLAGVLGLTQTATKALLNLSFCRVAEFQQRGVVHLHAFILADVAEEIGLNRRQKWVWLGALEAEGYVTVEQIGKRNPVVASRPWSIEAP